jgi:nitrogen fixation protein NifQ
MIMLPVMRHPRAIAIMLAPLSPRCTSARDSLFEQLRRHGAGLANDEFLAHLLVGRALGKGVLSNDLGLGRARFAALLRRHFPALAWRPVVVADGGPKLQVEFDDLLAFLCGEIDPMVASAADIAHIIAVACMGADHLWQDLGLPSRRELSKMIALNLPGLARANDRDMKWKKFFYRELCRREEIHVCASPSCEACSDYDKCFGPEE